MNLFDVAVQIVRADAAMLRAGVPMEQRSLALEKLTDSIIREELDKPAQTVTPFRRKP